MLILSYVWGEKLVSFENVVYIVEIFEKNCPVGHLDNLVRE